MEFKVQDANEKELSDTAGAALLQINEKDYAASLVSKGFRMECIPNHDRKEE